METEVRATLVADASSFTAGMHRAERALDEFDRKATRTGFTLTRLSGLIGTLTTATAFFGRSAFRAATELDEMEITMSAIGAATGLGSQRISEAASAIEAMGIEMAEARRIAVQFAQNNLELADAHRLARVAQDLAVVSQRNSTQTLNQLVRAVITGNSLMLRNAGVMTGAGEAYRRYAEELGVSTAALDSAQRSQAILNVIIEEGALVAGAYEGAMDNAGKVLRSFPRMLQNIRIAFGNTLLTGMNPLILGAYRLTQTFAESLHILPEYNEATGEMTYSSGGLINAIRALETVMTGILSPITNGIAYLNEMIRGFEMTEQQALNLANRIGPLVPLITAFGASLSAVAATTLLRFIPGIRAFEPAINPAIVGFLAFVATSSEVQGALRDMWAAIQPLMPAIQEVAEIVIEFAMAIGTSLIPIVVDLVTILIQALTPLLNWLAATETGETMVRLLAIAFVVAKKNLANLVYTMAVSGIKALVNFGRRLVVAATNTRVFAATAREAARTQQMAAFASMTFSSALNKLKIAIRGVLAATGIGLLIVGLSLVIEAFMRGWQTSQRFRDIVVEAINTVIGAVEKMANAIIRFANRFLPRAARMAEMEFGRMSRSIIKDAEDVADAMGMFDELVERIQRPGSDEDLDRQAELAAQLASNLGDASAGASRLEDQLRRVNQVGYDFTRWALDIVNTKEPVEKAMDEVAYQTNKFKDALDDASKSAEDLTREFSSMASAVRSQLGNALSHARNELQRAKMAFDDFSNAIQSSIMGTINFGAALEAGSGLIAAFEDLRNNVTGTLSGLLEFRTLASAPTSRQYVGFVKSLADAVGHLEDTVDDSFLGRLRQRRDDIREFGESLQALAEMGISEAAMRQITAAGHEAGLSMARELIAGGEEAIADVNMLTDDVMDLISTLSTDIAEEFYEGGGKNGSEFVDGLMEQAEQAEDFAAKIRQLIEMGLEPAAIRQVLAAGREAGSRIADELIAGGTTVVNKVNEMYKAVEKVARDTGEFGARRFFQAGVDAGQALVDGIARTIQANDALISNLLEQVAAKLRALEARNAAAAAAAAQKAIVVEDTVRPTPPTPTTTAIGGVDPAIASSWERDPGMIARSQASMREQAAAAGVPAAFNIPPSQPSAASVIINQVNNITSNVDASRVTNQLDWNIRQLLR